MATTTFECNSNNDLFLPDGRNLVLITGQAACAQNITQKCLMTLGENQYNTADGVDYFGTVFTPQPNYDDARASLSSNILRCPDVLMIESLTIDVEGGTFNYSAQVHTSDFGVIPVSDGVTS